MKAKNISLLYGLVAVASILIFLGCPVQPQPRPAGSPEQIPSVGATSLPVSTRDFLEEALRVISRDGERNAVGGIRGSGSLNLAENVLLQWEVDSPSAGKVSLKGPIAARMQTRALAAPFSTGRIDPVMSLTGNCAIEGNFDKLKLSNGFIVSGTIYQKLDTNLPIVLDIRKVSDDAQSITECTLSSKAKVALTTTIALSVKNSAGAGAKYIITFAGNKEESRSDILVNGATPPAPPPAPTPVAARPPLTDAPRDALPPSGILGLDRLTGQYMGWFFETMGTVQVMVYDDTSNVLLDQYSIPLYELPFTNTVFAFIK